LLIFLRLQIDVAVNATEAGVIKEFFVKEEDTVTVGQDLVRVETGGEKPASSGEQEKPKEESKPPVQSESKPAEPEQSKSQPEPTKSEKPAPPQPKEQPAEKPQKKSEPESAAASGPAPTPGNREERRVGVSGPFGVILMVLHFFFFSAV
jgi:2-oxoglutarate dehydrogenase E2 component (dihydrolipoamide succinyltransferase)